MGQAGTIKIAQEVYEEIVAGSEKDSLANWAKQDDVKKSLLLAEAAHVAHVRTVVATGYASDLNDEELEKLGRDPFLIAHALADRDNRTVVTTEVSKPNKQRGNRHIPDVCASVGVSCCDTFQLTEALDFRTSGGS